MRANSVIASSSPLTTVPASQAAQHALTMQGAPSPSSPPPGSTSRNRLPLPALTLPPPAPALEMSSIPDANTGKERSLQINVDSEDDARAVIQHLQAIKDAYDLLAATNGVTSIEFAINENIARKVESTLYGAVPWTHTYTKLVKPFDGNVLFPLPHYQHPLTQEQRIEIADAVNAATNAMRIWPPALPPEPLAGTPAVPLPVLPTANVSAAANAAVDGGVGAQKPGKSSRPVPATTAAG